MSHAGLFKQLEAVSDKLLHTWKLNIDNHYHRLALPENLRDYLRILPAFVNGSAYGLDTEFVHGI